MSCRGGGGSGHWEGGSMRDDTHKWPEMTKSSSKQLDQKKSAKWSQLSPCHLSSLRKWCQNCCILFILSARYARPIGEMHLPPCCHFYMHRKRCVWLAHRAVRCKHKCEWKISQSDKSMSRLQCALLEHFQSKGLHENKK